MTVLLAIIVSLWYWFWSSLPFYSLMPVVQHPVCMALFIGIVMHNVPAAMVMGATLEALYLGLLPTGGNLPADGALASCIAIPIALSTGMNVSTAVTLAVPVGLLGGILLQLRFIINGRFVQLADKYAEDCNTKGIFRCAVVYPMIAMFILRVPLVFSALYFGTDAIKSFLNIIPLWVQHGLTIAGGILPALGFALTVYIIGKKQLIPYFLIGFFMIKYLNITTTGAAIFAVCIALIVVFGKSKQLASTETSTETSTDDDF